MSLRSDHPIAHRLWQGMHQRCNAKAPAVYRKYGARGITVCERWTGREGFARFLVDMGERPSPVHSIDRIDNDKGYEPGNCRWATPRQQGSNQQKSLVTYEESMAVDIARAEAHGHPALAARRRAELEAYRTETAKAAERGRKLADRQRHDDTDGCDPFRDGDGVCEICGERVEVPEPTADEIEDAMEREDERRSAERYANAKEYGR